MYIAALSGPVCVPRIAYTELEPERKADNRSQVNSASGLGIFAALSGHYILSCAGITVARSFPTQCLWSHDYVL